VAATVGGRTGEIPGRMLVIYALPTRAHHDVVSFAEVDKGGHFAA
jgi:hypothetical protein